MSIRTNALGYYGDLAPELQTLLRKNGMQAHIISDGADVKLAVQGHDSPLLTYDLNPQQLKALTDWGSTYANKHAYDTFAALVSENFHLPKDFVHARNANGRVVMGLHGYRIGTGEYGRQPNMWNRYGILGWTPRMQDGFHMRRVGGSLYMGGAPMVADRPDGRIKPGELQNGGYGFYYKGQSAQQTQTAENRQQGYDVLSELKGIVPQIQERQKSDKAAIAYSDRITSDVYFTKDSWKEILDSHGLVLDENSKTLTVQSMAINRDFVYDLSDEELNTLMNASIKDVSLEKRLDVLNGIIGPDYVKGVTMDALNSREQINIAVKPEVIAEITAQEKESYKVQQENVILEPQMLESLSPFIAPIEESRDVAHVDGQSVYDNGKGWFREGQYGREVTVQDIKVEPVKVQDDEKRQTSMKYRMTAVINGEAITHEISQKQYDKFMAVDDYHRMKLFSQVFKEVDMKDLPQEREGKHFGIGLLAALTVAGELARGPMMHHHAPDLYMERHAGGSIYMKPGVDSPQDIASRAFEAGINAAEHGVGLGR
jgi:hypothetical protein